MELTVAEKLHIIMKRTGVGMSELADRSEQTRQNLSNKFARNNFQESEVRKLANALGCKAEVIFTLPDGTTI